VTHPDSPYTELSASYNSCKLSAASAFAQSLPARCRLRGHSHEHFIMRTTEPGDISKGVWKGREVVRRGCSRWPKKLHSVHKYVGASSSRIKSRRCLTFAEVVGKYILQARGTATSSATDLCSSSAYCSLPLGVDCSSRRNTLAMVDYNDTNTADTETAT
jgi:hypothetical protein